MTWFPHRLPLPPTLARALAIGGVNPSLVFDRGFDRWTESWEVIKAQENVTEGRQHFLTAFAERHEPPKPPPEGFEARIERRLQVLEDLGARVLPARSETRLVMGLGLAHPTETGFLLDRLTGSPYLPATSVKGLLRSAARWVADGELAVPGIDTEDDPVTFWREHRERLFGPANVPGVTAAQGELTVYDAFPERWPRLEVDVLTPHYRGYYGDSNDGTVPPADWDDPVPVPFLTVAPGASFVFAFGARGTATENDLDRVETLLRVALRELGIGAKTSSGYGLVQVLGEDPAAEAASRILWPDAQVSWDPGQKLLTAHQDGNKARRKGDDARALLDELPDAARQRLTGKVPGRKKKKKRKPLVCDVEVIQHSEEWFELVRLLVKED